MKKPSSVKELCEYIWHLEEKFDLMLLEVDTVRVWQYLRMNIYYELAQKLNILESSKVEQNIMDKIVNLGKLIYNSIFYNPYYINSCDIMFCSSGGIKKVDGKYIDIYTYDMINDLNKNNIVCELRRSSQFSDLMKKNDRNKYLDYIVLYSLVVSKFKRLNIENLQFINNIEIYILETIGVSIDLKSKFINATKRFLLERKNYTKILLKLRPKVIYLVQSYGSYAPLIYAAKKLNIEVIELQHGTFSQYHLGYSFPINQEELIYFPDKFFVWNEFWKDLISFPIDNENIIIHPSKYMQSQKHKYNKYQKNKNQAIILSQGALSSQIAREILKNWDFFKNMEVKYKLHPSEYGKWENNKYLSDLQKYTNIEICEDEDLYRLLATSKIQIGVFSTAIYEGLEFNCETILLNLPGIEYMNKLVKIGKATMLEDIIKNRIKK